MDKLGQQEDMLRECPMISTLQHSISITQATEQLRIIFVTANVGSLFENMEGILNGWLEEFSKAVENKPCHFLAIHMQEVGGKDYEKSMEHLDQLIKSLVSLKSLNNFSRFYVFMNTDFTDQEDFTALGNVYFVSNQVQNISLWNFEESAFESVTASIIHSGNAHTNQYVISKKYPRTFFPVVKWSRKGYMMTRWKFEQTSMDLINLHLFHDASNLSAIKKDKSTYRHCRAYALDYTLDSLFEHNLDGKNVAIFGDFNFRLNAHEFLKGFTEADHLDNNGNPHPDQSLVFRGTSGEIILDKKRFEMDEQVTKYFSENFMKMLIYDDEPHRFKGCLKEPERTFPPSYPYSENVDEPSKYMGTRCPSWCDRVFISEGLRKLIEDGQQHAATAVAKDNYKHRLVYDYIGKERCTGDHKPVFLYCSLNVDRSAALKEDDDTSHYRYSQNSETAYNGNLMMLRINGYTLKSIGDGSDWTVHDYAIYKNPHLMDIVSIREAVSKNPPGDPVEADLRMRSKRVNTLWTKVKAVSVFVASSNHRRGSWYTSDEEDADSLDTIFPSESTGRESSEATTSVNRRETCLKPTGSMSIKNLTVQPTCSSKKRLSTMRSRSSVIIEQSEQHPGNNANNIPVPADVQGERRRSNRMSVVSAQSVLADDTIKRWNEAARQVRRTQQRLLAESRRSLLSKSLSTFRKNARECQCWKTTNKCCIM